jgi:Ca-activated chloride channel homolog
MTTEWLSGFIFLRPLWLLALPPLLALAWILHRQARYRSGWESILPARWQPLLLEPGGAARGFTIPLLAAGWCLAILALAGPALRGSVHLTEQNQASVVVALDLSRNMLATDLSPSRLERAQRKIQDLMRLPEGYQVGLVVYAGSAHRVTPVSDDQATLANLLGALEPTLMPSQGNDTAAALSLARSMIEHLPRRTSMILLVTSGLEGAEMEAIEQHAAALGRQLAILGVGTAAGSPVALPEGGFMRDPEGRILLPRLDAQALASLARRHGAGYHSITRDDADLRHLLARLESTLQASNDPQLVVKDMGHWLLLPLLLLAASALRRGWLGLVLIGALLPQPAQAGWDELWQRPDQRAMDLLQRQRPAEAATQFDDPAWRSWALFQAEQFEAAAAGYKQVIETDPDSADNHYNYGTLLALAGRYDEALEAFEQALTRQPEHQPARHNRAQVEALLEQLRAQAELEAEAADDSDGETTAADSDRAPPPESGQSNGEQTNHEQSTADAGPAEVAPGEQTAGPQSQPPAGQPASPVETAIDADISSAPGDSRDNGGDASTGPGNSQPFEREQAQALRQWLEDIPDDPGELLRRKFLHQHLHRRESQP